MDPNSGTVALLETARALSAVANATGWRPRRTIAFCSVDAEEFGLIGSTEFAEEYLKVLQQRAVALINVDVGVKGHVTLLATATPSLYQTLIRAAKTVPNPNQGEVALGRATVYDSWIYYFPNDSFVPEQPRMRVPDSGSDQSTFLSFVGVPSAYLTYFCDPTIKRDCYELYHTMFEVPWTIETYIDPGYKALTAMTQLWTEIARDLSDTLVIPFDVNDYATVLSLAVKQLNVYLNSKIIPSIITTYPMIMSNLFNSSDRFTTVANNLQLVVDGINSGKKSASLRQVEMLNSRLMGLERTFINDRGLYPQREAARHVLFATSIHDHYSGTMGAGVYDSVEYYLAAVQNNDVTQQQFWLQRIEITISELHNTLDRVFGWCLNGERSALAPLSRALDNPNKSPLQHAVAGVERSKSESDQLPLADVQRPSSKKTGNVGFNGVNTAECLRDLHLLEKRRLSGEYPILNEAGLDLDP
uniref:Peptidase M28 domain-containing protein n=1 Tax=Plectus sambesii TaxID=2011161 RepID=A0A914X0Q2_9BILA